MKSINIQSILITFLVFVFILAGLAMNFKNQMTHMEKILEHLDEEVDETRTSVERLLKKKNLTVGTVQKGSEQPQVELGVTEYDFGVISKKDGIVSTNFAVSNVGKTALTIGDITTSCGCTSAEISAASVKPGGNAVLTVNFDPNFHEEPKGRFSRSVFVPTNDPENEELEFTIFVEIKD
ncbi:MAG: DUF1573 domain-containing protein [Candidatus Niyogibacteria bacterium]|nr:DUF1573 domain-containing protein [Candidatus Niyogibacteria bacterium]